MRSKAIRNIRNGKKLMLIAATLLATVLISACASGEGNMRSDGEAAGSEITLSPESIQGVWVGILETGNGAIRLVFRSSDDGSWMMDSPDQGATGLPAELQLKQNNTVKFDVPSVGGYFQGTFTDTRSIDGTWYQGGARFPLVLEPQDTRPEISRPQEPEPPYPYVSRDLYFRNDSADIQLAGTLTLPRGEGPFPAVVLVSGSGPQNRDEELMGHKPFLVLADYLTRQGIAVLRYDDRGVGLSEGDFQNATSPDLASDALAAWKYLVSQDETDPLRTGIAGHSEGGLIGIYLGYRNPEIPFLVLLAPSVLQGREQLLLQSEIIMRRSGVSEDAIRRELDAAKSIYDILQEIPVEESLPPETISRLEDQYRKMGLSGSRLDNALRQITSQWFRSFLSYDPSTEINELEMPALAVFGGLDTQVDARANSAPITTENIDVVTLDGLNHLFQEAESGLPAEYGSISETMNPRLLELVSSWINGR